MIIQNERENILSGINNKTAKQAATIAGVHSGHFVEVIHF